MKNFESNVQYIKYLVNKEVANRFFSGTLVPGPFLERDIAEAIIPGPKAMFRCCIYKERHIIEDRVHLVLEPTKGNVVINVLDSACDECPLDRLWSAIPAAAVWAISVRKTVPEVRFPL
ncbi:MAG: hypothetical protein IJY52_01710 [Anaerotignum sp.]|nr:hypothetical protein [Anaerotignum sp.]